MAFFKTDEERKKEEQEEIKKHEASILKFMSYTGKVGYIHQGLSYAGVWGVRNNGKMKFKSSRIEIFDTKLLIERNKMLIEFSNIKEIFQGSRTEAIIILNNDSGIPIQSYDNTKTSNLRLKAFINVLNRLIEDYKSNHNNDIETITNEEKLGDKFDKLIKLGEMYDKGLLTNEEFVSLKQELLSGNNAEPANTSEENVETSENICENCGSDVEEDSKFCAECGTEIK